MHATRCRSIPSIPAFCIWQAKHKVEGSWRPGTRYWCSYPSACCSD
jgi:hypothetical protein